MIVYIVRRLIAAVLLLFVVTAVTFLIFFGVPRLGGATADDLASRYVGKTAGPGFNSVWGASIAAPVNEEILKLLGVAALALMAPSAVRGALDGWGYGALSGLGFQFAENFLYVLNTIVLIKIS